MKKNKGAPAISPQSPNNKIITYSFCESFKDKFVEYIKEEYIRTNKDLSRLAIVFGGKRPSMFIKRDLARHFKKSFYPPRFFTIDEFIRYTIAKSEDFSQARDLEHCYLLYHLAQKVTPQILKGREAFARFLPWIREILKFIDQLDIENIGEESLRNIQSNAQIGYDVPEDINSLLQSIVALRQAYHNEIRNNKTYSRGLQYLRAAELCGGQDFDEFDQILFCNFFYFHRTEEVIVKNLYERGKATLFFQGDQRKWPVLERISKMFEFPIQEGVKPKAPEFELSFYESFDIHSQVGLVREILKETKSSDDTVIVLPDADRLIPLLSEIAPLIENYNISMGYPLKRSSLYTLFDLVFKAQLSFKDGRYYTKDYLKALRHPFIKNLKLSTDSSVTRVLVHKIEEILTGQEKTAISGSSFIDPKEILGLEDLYELTGEMLSRMDIKIKKEEMRSVLRDIHDLVFHRWEAIARFRDFANVLELFISVLIEKSFLHNYPLNLNIASEIYAIADEFRHVSFAEEHFEKEEVFRIFEQKIEHAFIKFKGSPLKGLQILGLLETRSLNFDHVIVLDVNEGTLPSLRIHEPLIPREVMISLGLDRLELEEEIQRYQFMRLISSAKHVHLLYQKSKDKERSRFIEELIWEEQKKRATVDDIAVVKPGFHVNINPEVKRVKKTPAVIEFLKQHTYSASSINAYMNNPMDFYTKYVLGLRERDDLLDEPEARHVGTFIHKLLEEAFKPYLGKAPKIDSLFANQIKALCEEHFAATFAKQMKSDSFLLKAVIDERINQFIEHERTDPARQVEKILYLEHRFKDTIALPVGDIKFLYVIDRIDQMKTGEIMIIDYKTGNADLIPKKLDQVAGMTLTRETIRELVKSFQIPLYFHYLHKQYPEDPVNAAFYNLKTMKLHKFIDAKTTFDRAGIDEIFLSALNFIMAEILDPDIDFVEDTGNTRY